MATKKKATPAKKNKKATPPKKQRTPKPKSIAEMSKEEYHAFLLDSARAVLPRIKSGETSMRAESMRLGLKSNGPWHAAFKEVLGGERAYKDMLAARPKHRRSNKTPTVEADKKAAKKKA